MDGVGNGNSKKPNVGVKRRRDSGVRLNERLDFGTKLPTEQERREARV
ncbi:hypothetical protein AGMMS50256_36830 [Betaproteobacteria bacterium]|nr:hypothetical protein AGMMS50256_36830 [Betaproteobacteria bacterium]